MNTSFRSFVHSLITEDLGGFVIDIEKETLDNGNYRKVLYTAPHLQLVLMSLLPNQEIGSEVHESNDQFIRVEQGTGRCILNGKDYPLQDGVSIVVPQGTEHNIINTGKDEMKMYVLYSPQHHDVGLTQKTKPNEK
jgi:mannose-6-phosphate isomerase-like protein (cupin superfamily)